MTQEFHISVTPVGNDDYLVRTERVAPGVPLAEEQLVWPVDKWLKQAQQLMHDPLMGLLQGQPPNRIGAYDFPQYPGQSFDPNLSQPPLSLVDLGQHLYSSLFQGTLRDSWMTAQGIAQHRGEVLRLRLGLKGPRLPRLPWEVLTAGESVSEKQRQQSRLVQASRPIATGTDIIFSRYQPGPGLVGNGLQWIAEPDQPLRILMAIAAPTDQERLELKQEATHLQQELRHQNSAFPEGLADPQPDIQVTILEQPSREQLTQALEQGQYQVLHYAGHSNLGSAGGDLYLVNHRTGLTETLSGDDLAGLLVNNGIRMAVFNSCRGAYTAAGDLTLGTAERSLTEALVSRDIPAVLAMAERIPDDVALTLTRLFYRNLKQGYPVDLSLSRARQGLISAYGSDQLYWALPILYLHPEFDGYLIAGDRTRDNPADSLVRVPQVYDVPSPPILPTDLVTGALPQAQYLQPADADLEVGFEDDQDWAIATGSDLIPDLMGGEDGEFSDWDDLEYEDELDDEADLSYEEDISTVANLIEQLSQQQPEPQGIIPAPAHETLLPNVGRSEAEVYHQNPEQPPYPASAIAPTSTALSPFPNIEGPPDIQPESAMPPSKPPTDRSYLLGLNRSTLVPILSAVGVVAIAIVSLSTVSERWFQPRRPSPAELLERSELLTGIAGSGSADTNRLSGSDVNLATADTATVTAIAISQIDQNQLSNGQIAIAELLNRNALPQAEAALGNFAADQLANPEISFLRGRLAWQSIQVGNRDYSVDDALRAWDTAARGAPNLPQYHNALGFAYYAEGRFSEATEAWLQVLSLLESEQAIASKQLPGESPTQSEMALPNNFLTSDSALTAYAGIALVLMQTADEQAPESPKAVQSKATKLYQMVIAQDPTRFQTTALSRNWLWTESMIQDWQTLSTLAP